MPSRERILVIRHRAAGDLLLTTPALRALRLGAPEAEIHVLVSRGMEELLEGNPDVDHILALDRTSLPSQAATYARLARGGYRRVLDLVSNPRTAVMTALTRAPIRAGYDIPGRAWAYTVRVPREPIGSDGRPVLRYAPEAALDIVRALGFEARGLGLRFRAGEPAHRRIDAWLGAQGGALGARPIVACLPTGSWPAKTWLPERFAAAMDVLAEQASVVWIWGPGEEATVTAVRARMTRPSWMAPPTGWQDLGALLSRCALLVTNDSGPKHVAVAVGTPTVTLYGPTHPRTWHPPAGAHVAVVAADLECLHCNANHCPLEGARFHRCMRDIGVERVVEASRALLRGAEREVPCAGS